MKSWRKFLTPRLWRSASEIFEIFYEYLIFLVSTKHSDQDTGDPIESPPTGDYKVQPEYQVGCNQSNSKYFNKKVKIFQGRLVWISGAPGLGKSTNAQLLGRHHGQIYYHRYLLNSLMFQAMFTMRWITLMTSGTPSCHWRLRTPAWAG